MAVGVVGIVVLLILPVPAFLLDILLALSITSAVLILMTALMMKKALEFTAFPTVLLMATLFRLGLNIASTRLILGHGHEGTDGAGHIIQAFGALMMSGNFVIGLIVFAILVVVNFVVVTKGSGRIAEVAARLTPRLHATASRWRSTPTSSGIADQEEGKRRTRKDLEFDYLLERGRRQQVRARRRHGRPDHRRHQRGRRHPDRRGAAQAAAGPGGQLLHHHDHRRRPRSARSPALRDLDRRRPAGVEGGASRAPPTRLW